jgi:pimeloyl-ACP methyl ester carboxylesterase
VCSPTYGQQMTTIASDWNDIAGVVDYLRALRGATKVSMLAWSLGGPRAGGYAAQNPDKVARLVLLAPAYNRSPDQYEESVKKALWRAVLESDPVGATLGSKSKVLVDLACSSHNAMWEKNHRLLFQASLEWLTKGTVNGAEQGVVRLGY